MKQQTSSLAGWAWVMYPVLVSFFIFGSIMYWQNYGAGQLDQLSGKQERAAAEEEKLALARNKLGVLRQVDLARENENLAWTVTVMPTAKQVWLMINELGVAASESGAALVKYAGTVGEVTEASAAGVVEPLRVEAEYAVTDFAQVRRLLSRLENILPLVRIVSVEYNRTTAKVVVEGSWSGWTKVSLDALAPLPIYQAELAEVQTKLAGYARLAEGEEVGGATGSGEVNPF